MAHLESEINFKCPDCGAIVVDDVTVQEEEIGQYSSVNETDIACEQCRRVFLLNITNSGGLVHANLPESPGVIINTSRCVIVDDILDHRNYEISSSPEDELRYALMEIRNVVTAGTDSLYEPTLHRMAFVQQFSALEAFLCDTLIKSLRNSSYALERMIRINKDLKRISLTLDEVHNNPGIVTDSVESLIRGEAFHNLGKVELLFDIAFQFKIFSDKDVKARLFSAIPVRHDCVHRNGKRIDGSLREEVNHAYVWQMEYDIISVLNHTVFEISRRKISKFENDDFYIPL
ncbi:hypothetical protein [Sphingomonas panacis]|uniref:hypothetical protein n=1 Tax=Sphingomonas panacis TaxID=1560345 RepID=UPI0012374795|nr:hypothetical protein [Sphingomonas panacis]